MFPIIDIVATLGGMVIPPLFNLLKQKIGKNDESPEATLSSLATTKPEAIAGFVTGYAQLLEAKIKEFNRDVVGILPPWLTALRGAIRPVCTVFAIVMLFLDGSTITLTEGARATYEIIAGSWFGSRFTLK